MLISFTLNGLSLSKRALEQTLQSADGGVFNSLMPGAGTHLPALNSTLRRQLLISWGELKNKRCGGLWNVQPWQTIERMVIWHELTLQFYIPKEVDLIWTGFSPPAMQTRLSNEQCNFIFAKLENGCIIHPTGPQQTKIKVKAIPLVLL